MIVIYDLRRKLRLWAFFQKKRPRLCRANKMHAFWRLLYRHASAEALAPAVRGRIDLRTKETQHTTKPSACCAWAETIYFR